MRYLPAMFLAFMLLSVCPSASNAGVVNTTGSVSLTSPPTSVFTGDLISDSLITAFAERQGLVLPQSLTFNITQPGTSPGPIDINTSPGDIAAGTTVNSYFVHFESISGTRPNPVLLSGSITFDSDVLGIAVYGRRLDDSDPILGLPSVLYPTGEDRDLEIVGGGVVGVIGNDSITLSADRRTVTFNLGNTGGPDQARIVTATVPEASTLALAGIGALFLGAWKLSRRRKLFSQGSQGVDELTRAHCAEDSRGKLKHRNA